MSDNRAHSRFGGSSALRWLNCAGSTALNAGIPDAPRGDASEGTAKHTLAEECLKENLHPRHFLGEKFDGIEITEAMCDEVVVYINAILHEVAQTETSEYYVEQGFVLDIPGADPGEVFGTNDCFVFHPETGRLRVFDFKGGFQEVDVEDCDQLKFYALGVIHSHPDWRIKKIVLTIVQPGGLNGEDVRDWEFNLVDMLEFAGDIEAAIKRAKDYEKHGSGRDAFVAGPWCHSTYCPAFSAGKCPSVEAKALAGVGFNFDGVKPVRVADITPDVLPEPSRLDLTELAKIVDGLDYLTAWAGRCQQYLEAMMLTQGAQAPGWKVVDKIGRAKWIDDPQQIVSYADMMFEIPAAQMMPPKIITITDAEKRLKAAGATKDQIDTFKLKFTIKDSSGRTIARASDRRPAVDVVAADFAGVKIAAE